ncbi:IS110 family transposase [Gordonia iterans]|uniref:IS110 family transposase n=1 Tax=Gordonia iterans TaxID=1004901 RepID=A0A2S0KDM2_9ACTN|nr:IS110 family transposase [Gordonia iterans]AVL99091.1 IS110 family transposase [Gordonia iterans]AVL99784.1 IS110 family transposase [Gordonia iterans]AVM00227.1 IS110 family transposase [Gordonia iterans]
MSSMQLRRDDVIIGVDTHKDNHVAVAIDGLGGRLGDVVISATVAGFDELVTFCLALVGPAGSLIGFGVEGTGSYGVGLARYLRNHGHQVHEIARPARAAERRLAGKNDTIDAEHAARQLLAGHGLSAPKTADGAVETIRLVKIAYDGAVQARTTTMITLKATLATGSEALRAKLEKLTDHKLITACAALEGPTPLPPVRRGAPAVVVPNDPEAAMRHVLSSMAQRWLALHEEAKAHAASLKTLTAATAPRLIEAVGVGYDTAAQMLITAGDNTNRIKSEAAFAKMCGACPIPAGSGKTNNRHRLYRGGNRQANAALYRVVIVRMRWHQPTIDYVARRTAEGLSKREIIRCLKRYLARELFRLLPTPDTTAEPRVDEPEIAA